MKTKDRHWLVCCSVALSAALYLAAASVLDAAEATKEKRELAWRETPASLALLSGDRVVWQFNHLRDGKEKGCPYFHPLATMEGAVLTDLRPADHPLASRFAFRLEEDQRAGGLLDLARRQGALARQADGAY